MNSDDYAIGRARQVLTDANAHGWATHSDADMADMFGRLKASVEILLGVIDRGNARPVRPVQGGPEFVELTRQAVLEVERLQSGTRRLDAFARALLETLEAGA